MNDYLEGFEDGRVTGRLEMFGLLLAAVGLGTLFFFLWIYQP